MKSKQHPLGLVSFPLVVILVSLLACQSGNTVSTETPVPTQPALPTYTTYPTFTPYPTGTATPAPEVLLFDDFGSDKSCFSFYSDSNATARMESGVFLMNILKSNIIFRVWCQNQTFSDFILEVEAGVPENTLGDIRYGVLFRETGGKYYRYRISSSNNKAPYFCLEYYDGVTFFPLTGSSFASGNCWVLLPENVLQSQKNTFRVSATGDIINIYLNDEILALIRDTQLTTGRIGFVAETSDQETIEVRFDNLRLVEP
jgi:hypothetical protein